MAAVKPLYKNDEKKPSLRSWFDRRFIGDSLQCQYEDIPT